MSLWSSDAQTMDTTSNRSADEYIDDALINDSVKKLLSDNSDTHHFDLAADLLSNATNASHSAVNCGQIGGHSGATVQEGMDLVDALDTLVQHLSRETKALPNDLEANDSNVNTLSSIERVFTDHSYCKMDYFNFSHTGAAQTPDVQPTDKPYGQTSPQKSNLTTTPSSPAVQSSTFTSFNDNSYASSSTTSATSPAPQTPGSPPIPSTPPSSLSAGKCGSKTAAASRRSQRQIDRIEKSVLEKIKAENQEMLKREKQEMESPNKIRQPIEPIDDNKDVDESQLVIDLDKKKDNKTNANQSNNNKKRIKRSKSQNEPTNKKSRMDSKHRTPDRSNAKTGELLSKCETPSAQKPETSEMDDVIAALKSGVTDSEDNDKTPGNGGRMQRNRRKPKRWDDDEVEVDFSGQLGILAEDQIKTKENEQVFDKNIDENANNKKVLDSENNNQINDKNNESFDEKKSKENDSQLSSDEDLEDETGSDFGSEDDPDKLWCTCREAHNDRFMIGCDSCEEWFHGTCVNVTKQQGRNMEKAGQEWLCQTCIKGIEDGMSRTELKKQADHKREKLEADERIRAQTKRAAKERFLKREKSREITKHRERRNSEGKQQKSPHKQVSAEQKGSNLAKKVIQMPPKKRELHLRQETEEKEKLKKLIQSSKQKLDKKTELLSKKRTKEKERLISESEIAQKVPGIEPISKVVPIVRRPEVKKKHKDAIDPTVQDLFKAEPIKKTSISTPPTPTTPGTPGSSTPFSRKSSVDSRRMSTSGSSERQCPSGCGKTVRSETTIYCSQECIETHVKERVKQLKAVRRDKVSAGIKLKEFDDRCVVVEKISGRILSGKEGIPEKDVLEFIKSNPLFEVMKPPNIRDKKREELNSKTPQKSNKKEEKRVNRSNSRESEGDLIRSNVKTSLKEILSLRSKEANDMSISSEEIRKIANRIEEELFKLFKDTSNKYKNKYRSLIFNLKDSKNQGLFRKVVNGKINPERLVQMSAEELASSELAKWREREKISMLEMIKRDAADKVNQVIVKKTHKGEEVIESTIVNESPLETKIDDTKPTNTTSTPVSGVSTLLDDLMGGSSVDTTALHRTHLFSNNCRICTNKQTDDTKQEVSKRTTSLSSTKDESLRPTPKRVRVDPDSANRILLEAAKLSSTSAKRKASADDYDNSQEVPTSTVSLSSPEVPTSSSASRPVWKGTVFMQDVAKFAANAVKVSGSVGDFLSQDISGQVTVIGRIAPEQVLDYVKKLRYSSRTEIGLVKFVSPEEERRGYDAFFEYLDTRKRYGVVGNTGKALKDFYILPLPRNGDVPEVLLPFDGPGLDKKSNRPNLLLGILIRSKVLTRAQTPQTSSTNTSLTKSKASNAVSNTSEFRSYTPPPKSSSNESSPEDSKDADDISYTPPRTASNSWKPTKAKISAPDDEPYDPEEAELSNSNSLPISSTPSMEELMEQIAKSTNPVEMTSSVLSAIAGSSNLELQRRLLEQLTAKVDEQKRQLEVQKAEAEAQSSKSLNSTPHIPGLDGQFASTLKDIKMPDNIHDILSTVKQKTQEIEEQQERLRAVAAAGFKFDDPIVKNFGSNAINDPIENSPEAEPMDLDEEVTPLKSNIIEVNIDVNTPPIAITTNTTTSNDVGAQPKSVTDPRLRSKKQTPLPSIAQESGAEQQVTGMTADELMQKAREQMAALAQMEANSGTTSTTVAATPVSTTTTNSNQINDKNSNKSQKIKIQWKRKK